MSNTRRQLAKMRKRLIGNLGRQIEGGDLTLLAAVNGALATIDAEAPQLDDEPMVRAVVADAPGMPINVALYAENGRGVAVEVSPIRAIVLVGQLIEAAVSRLGDAGREATS